MQQNELFEMFASSSFDLEAYKADELSGLSEFDLRKKFNKLKLMKSRINKSFHSFLETNYEDILKLEKEALNIKQNKLIEKNERINKKFDLFQAKDILNKSFIPSLNNTFTSMNYSFNSNLNQRYNNKYNNNYLILSRQKEEKLYEIENQVFNTKLLIALSLFTNTFNTNDLKYERVSFVLNTLKKSVYQYFEDIEFQNNELNESEQVEVKEIVLLLFKLPFENEDIQKSFKILDNFLKKQSIIYKKYIRNSLESRHNIIFGTENFITEFADVIQFFHDLINIKIESKQELNTKEQISTDKFIGYERAEKVFMLKSKAYLFIFDIIKYYSIHIKQSVDNDEERKIEVLQIWEDFDSKGLLNLRNMLEQLLK